MKRIFKKNQIIITTLAIMIAIAGYLNYSGKILNEKTNLTNSDDSTVLLTDDSVSSVSSDTYADTYTDIVSLDGDGSEEASLDSGTVQTGNVGEAVLASSSSADNVLASAKLNREQVRAKNKETLLEIINNDNIGEDQKQNAISTMTEMTQVAEKESAAELLLESKGFQDCVVSISNDSCDVIVDAAELTDAQRAQIEDVVKRKTDIAGENIIITPKNYISESLEK